VDERAHRYARGRGVSRVLYAVVRVVAWILLRFWFRLTVEGEEHVPREGAAIVAANHKSLLDPFFLGLSTRRHMRFMAKAELFRGPLGWFVSRLGAFPVRRGAADTEALTTARAILDGGGLLIMFPEGTRIEDPDALGSPHHGAGRLAVQSGAPILPTAVYGTSQLWLGPIPKPRRIGIAFLAPVPATGGESVDDLIDRQVWPAVREEYGRLQPPPGLIAAALAALGIGGGIAARRRAAPPRILGVVPPRRLRRRRRRRFSFRASRGRR
jgi:1-acyl-sn-glycerol-3-phosphate acyltransferase